MKRIAVLMTCYNRVDTTLKCLQRLFNQEIPEGYSFDVWLVDDASPDKTGERVKAAYPQVNVIQGTGNLFWCKGMRLAWDKAAEAHEYDFYLWLNDDVVLNDFALKRLLIDSEELGENVIICGALYSPEVGGIFYGAPELRNCESLNEPKLINAGMHGNVVLIPQVIYKTIGGMAKGLVHQHGDFEYGYRARKFGFKVFVAGAIVGNCHANFGFDKRKLLNASLKKRIEMLFSPKGLGLKDYCRYKYLTVGCLGSVASFLKNLLLAVFPKAFIR